MTRFSTLSATQLFLLALLMSILTGALVSINTWYMAYRTLPIVHKDEQGLCVKVVNLENGHAFNCADVDVILRVYRAPK